MNELSASSNVEWRAYGRLDYGASHDLDAGLAEWAVLREHLRQMGLTELSQCVEIGCGGGRLTNALAGAFSVVHSLDVSSDRIAQASMAPNASKVHFHLVQGPPIPVVNDSSDLCISTHVFQHISSTSMIDEYFREIYRVLRPGGVMLIHLPVIGAHQRTGEMLEVVGRRLKDLVKSCALPLARLFFKSGIHTRFLPLADYRIFAWVKVGAFLQQTGFCRCATSHFALGRMAQLCICPEAHWVSIVGWKRRMKNGASVVSTLRSRWYPNGADPLHEGFFGMISARLRPGIRILDVGCGKGNIYPFPLEQLS